MALEFRICKKASTRWVPLRSIAPFPFAVPAADSLFPGRVDALDKARAKLGEVVAARPWNSYGILTYRDGRRADDQPVESLF